MKELSMPRHAYKKKKRNHGALTMLAGVIQHIWNSITNRPIALALEELR